MNDDNAKLIRYFVDKVQRGEITFDQVRQELVKRNVGEDDIKTIVRLVDEELQNQLLSNSGGVALNQLFVVGIVVMVLGIIFTVASFAGLFSFQKSYIVVFGYVPILAGLAIIFVGWRRKNQKNVKQFGSRMQDRQKD